MADRNMQIRGGQIKDGTISEAKLDISNAPVDGYLLRYNQSLSKFQWVSGNEAVTEIPAGLINGINPSYVLTDVPQAGTLHLYLNGIYQEEGSSGDYLLSGTSITFNIAPETDDILIGSYLKVATLGSLSHTQNTDTSLDAGGANEVSAADIKLAVDDSHAHTNSAELALVSDGDHDVRTDNPHGVDKADVGLTNVADINATVSSLQFILGDGANAIDAGVKGQIEIPFNCTITEAVLIGDQTGSIVVDIKRSTYANFSSTVSITASAKPTLSSSQKMKDATLTGWTVSLSAGDILEYVVDSASTVTRVLVSLKVDRT